MKLTLGQTLKNSVLSRHFNNPNWATDSLIETVQRGIRNGTTQFHYHLDEADYNTLEWKKIHAWAGLEDLKVHVISYSKEYSYIEFIVSYTC